MFTFNQEELDALMASSYADGVKYALENLKDVYGEGIEETDLWAEHM